MQKPVLGQGASEIMSVPKGYPMPHPSLDKLPDKTILHHLYWGKNNSCKTIGKLYGVDHTTVRRKFAKENIPIRTRLEGQRVAGKSKMGSNNVNWNGTGRKINKGYILVYKPDHPRAYQNYVLEHILVWEQASGKPLPKGWLIHHLNGIKDDNRPRNLVALPILKHSLVLAAKAKRIQELEAIIKGQGLLL